MAVTSDGRWAVSASADLFHADCQAGLFVATLELSGSTSMGDVEGAFMSICSFADPQGYPWFAPGAHGSCQDRSAAFSFGYQNGLAMADLLCSNNALQAVTAICGAP